MEISYADYAAYFENTGAFNYHLKSGSPAIGAGFAGSDVGAYGSYPDSLAPDTPTGVCSTVENSQISLRWNSSHDNLKVKGYEIYRNGEFVARTVNTAYADRNFALGTNYSYQVLAYDFYGNKSSLSNNASIIIPSPQNDLKKIKVYPNPYKPGSAGTYDNSKGIVFENVTENFNIKLFNLAGELIYNYSKDNSWNSFEWKAENNAGRKVQSGVYFYVVTNCKDNKKTTGKIIIVR